jgi:hypothetical protein
MIITNMKKEINCNELFCPLNRFDNSYEVSSNDLFFSFLILGFGVFLSTLIVSYLMPNDDSKLDEDKEESEDEDEDDKVEDEVEDEDEDEVEDEDEEEDEVEDEEEDEVEDEDEVEKSDVKYEYKYSEFFEELNEKEHCALTFEDKINMKKNVITESTPNGNVVMSYYFNEKEPELSAFQYYCNDRSIPYKYLDTVARKFAITYNCPELYLYLKTELMKGVDKIKQDKEKEKASAEMIKKEDEEKEKVESVFATFKKYKQEEPKTKKAKLRSLLVGKNRYTRLGNVEDYEKTLLPKKESDVKPISFAEYKKMMSSR